MPVCLISRSTGLYTRRLSIILFYQWQPTVTVDGLIPCFQLDCEKGQSRPSSVRVHEVHRLGLVFHIHFPFGSKNIESSNEKNKFSGSPSRKISVIGISWRKHRICSSTPKLVDTGRSRACNSGAQVEPAHFLFHRDTL